jgi:hypothetical protein
MCPTVNNISLDDIYENIESTYSGSTLADPSISASCNYTGYMAGMPISNTPAFLQEPYLSALKGFQYTVEGSVLTDFNRFMINKGTGYIVGTPGNCFFCTFAGTWIVRAWNNTTRIYKNGSLQTTINANGEQSLTSLAIGDRIECDRPFHFYYSGVEGATGAYGGFAGYTFATRNDRESTTNGNKIFAFCLDPEPEKSTGATSSEGAIIQLRIPSTTNPTTVTTGQAADNSKIFADSDDFFEDNMDISSFPTYLITSNFLICCWRGRHTTTDVYDSVPMFPLTNEQLYGWFSQQGHIIAVAGPAQHIDGQSANKTLIKRTGTGTGNGSGASSTSTQTTIMDINGQGFTSLAEWIYINPSQTGVSYFRGTPTTLFQNAGPNNQGQGMIFTAESQADGSGTEMTPFISQKAFNKFTVSAANVDTSNGYAAFITNGYSNSQAFTISRYNSSCVWQETRVLGLDGDDGFFSGTVNQRFTSTRFGTNVAEGDIFEFHSCTGGGWYDANTTKDDETVFFMTDEVTGSGFTTTSFSISGVVGGSYAGGTEESDGQCNATEITALGTLYTRRAGLSTPTTGTLLFTDSSCTTPFIDTFTGGVKTADLWFQNSPGRGTFAFQMGKGFITSGTLGSYQSTGMVVDQVTCSDRRYKKNIEKIGVSPSGINYYKFEFKNPTKYGKGEFTGTMAQENLHAVKGKEPMMLRYHLLDVEAQEWNGEDCNCKKDYCYNCNPCIPS